jgi:hypothetical protein
MIQRPQDDSKFQDPTKSSDTLTTVTCTGCPMGCQVTVSRGPGGDWLFNGPSVRAVNTTPARR